MTLIPNLKYDLINKFVYINVKKLPKVKKISINCSCKNNSYKNLATSLLALEFIFKQKGILTKAKKPNLTYKIRKNSPTGCKVTLRNRNFNRFTELLVNKILPNYKNFDGIFLKKRLKNFFSFDLNNVYVFSEIEKNYIYFKNLSKFQITFNFQCSQHTELKFLLKSLQFLLSFKN